MIQNSNKLKYYFYAFVLISQRYSCEKGSRTGRLQYKPIEDMVKNNLMLFGDFTCLDKAADDLKLE
jgi:hypothetical protein